MSVPPWHMLSAKSIMLDEDDVEETEVREIDDPRLLCIVRETAEFPFARAAVTVVFTNETPFDDAAFAKETGAMAAATPNAINKPQRVALRILEYYYW